MRRQTISGRIAISLALFSFSILLIAKTLGLFPDRREAVINGRLSLCEAVAIHCSMLAQGNDRRGIETTMQALVSRNDEVMSAALRGKDDQLLIQVGDHAAHWSAGDGTSTDSNVYVPISVGRHPWGTVEVAFAPIGQPGFWGFINSPFLRLVMFATALNALAFAVWLRRVLTHLDPSRVVPTRVRAALDTLAEGLLVVDNKGRIVLANKAFVDTVGGNVDDLQGKRAEELPWQFDSPGDNPWQGIQSGQARQIGVPLKLETSARGPLSLMVNSAPIIDGDGKQRGTLATFDDVTAMEKKKAELINMLEALRTSRDKIREQNEQLQILATRDPLTGCLNRRSFFEEFTKAWQAAQQNSQPLSCLMLDVDHFKSVNDNHGHAMGDEVLRKVAATLRTTARANDVVGRFGGEEFCILMPSTDPDTAAEMAEQLRIATESLEFPRLKITASLGVSTAGWGAADIQELIDQADKCLYVAKRNGRNQVIRWDAVPEDIEIDEAQISRTAETEARVDLMQVPYHAVTSLVSALACRDPETAAHCSRVADLCVAVARDLMSVSETHLLETAALLHDIGKIGVPDSILLKPGRLEPDEMRLMEMHARMGVQILQSAFGCQELVDIVRYHSYDFAGDPSCPGGLRGEELPLSARIVAIADAYDAMVTDRVYRPAFPSEVAFAELRRCAGQQFDPQLVEHFISVISNRGGVERNRRREFSKELALNLSLQTEQIARAVDEQDFPALDDLATRLQATAVKYGIQDVEEIAGQLLDREDDQDGLTDLISAAHKLLDLCAAAHKVHVDVDDEMHDVDQLRRQLAHPRIPDPVADAVAVAPAAV